MKISKLSLLITTFLTLPLFGEEAATNVKKDVPKEAAATAIKKDVFKEALIEAYKTNPDLAAAQAAYQAAAEAEPQALAAFFPVVQLQQGTGYLTSTKYIQNSDGTSVQSLGDSYTSNLTWGVNVNLNLFKGLSSIASLSKAQYTVLSAAANFSATESKILNDAITAYMDYITKQKTLEAYIASEQSLSSLHEAAKTKFQVGEITRSDLLQALASYQAAKAQRIQGESDLETSRVNYQRIIGSTPGSLKLPVLPKDKLPKTLEEAIELTLKSNPAIIKAQFDEKAVNEGWTVTFSDFLPSIDAIVNFNSNRSATGNNDIFDSTINGGLQYGVTASWNIFTGLSSVSSLRAVAQNIEQSKFQLESARRIGIQNATQSWRALISVKNELVARKAAIDAAELALEGLRQGATLGAYTILQVLDTESKLVQARLDFAKAQQTEVVSTYQLLAAMGALSGQKLNLVEKAKKEG